VNNGQSVLPFPSKDTVFLITRRRSYVVSEPCAEGGDRLPFNLADGFKGDY